MSDSAAAEESGRSEAVLWAIPIAAGLLGLLIGFVVADARPDRYEQITTLVSANDGRTGVRDNRDLALEFLTGELDTNPPPSGVEVDIKSRLGSVLDILVTAPSPEQAAVVAEDLANLAVEVRQEAALRRFVVGIAANAAAIVELDDEIAGLERVIAGLSDSEPISLERLERDRTSLADSRNELKRQIVVGETQRNGAMPPISVSSSRPLGASNEPVQIASLVGAAAAMLALLFVAGATAKRD